MADNVLIAGAGAATAACDEATYSGDTAKIQLVRLVHVTGTEGSKSVEELIRAEDAASADGHNGIPALFVRAGSSPGTAGDYGFGSLSEEGAMQQVEAHSNIVRIATTSAGLHTSTTYTAGDQVGTQFTMAGASRASGGYGYIVGVTLINAHLTTVGAEVIGAYDVVVTRSSITLAADNAAYAISDADACKVVGVIQLAGAFDIGANRIAQAQNLRIPYDCSGGTSLYAGLITRSAHTFFTNVDDLQLVFFVELA